MCQSSDSRLDSRGFATARCQNIKILSPAVDEKVEAQIDLHDSKMFFISDWEPVVVFQKFIPCPSCKKWQCHISETFWCTRIGRLEKPEIDEPTALHCRRSTRVYQSILETCQTGTMCRVPLTCGDLNTCLSGPLNGMYESHPLSSSHLLIV